MWRDGNCGRVVSSVAALLKSILKGDVMAEVVIEALSADDWAAMLGLSKWM